MIAGRAASDVVHLMAELIDNALSYSPPGARSRSRPPRRTARSRSRSSTPASAWPARRSPRPTSRSRAAARSPSTPPAGWACSWSAASRRSTASRSSSAATPTAAASSPRSSCPTAVLGRRRPRGARLHAGRARVDEEPVAPLVVDEEPEEEYDPYLERIEEAIAAVTGLPRRRPGQVARPGRAARRPPRRSSMFDAAPTPSCRPAFEPTALPGLDDATPSSDQTEPVAAPAAELDDADEASRRGRHPGLRGRAPRRGRTPEEESPSIGDDEPERGHRRAGDARRSEVARPDHRRRGRRRRRRGHAPGPRPTSP